MPDFGFGFDDIKQGARWVRGELGGLFDLEADITVKSNAPREGRLRVNGRGTALDFFGTGDNTMILIAAAVVLVLIIRK